VKIIEGQGMAHFVEAARQAGFEAVAQGPDHGWFQIEMKKPSPREGG
jgi:hypothetical protein